MYVNGVLLPVIGENIQQPEIKYNAAQLYGRDKVSKNMEGYRAIETQPSNI